MLSSGCSFKPSPIPPEDRFKDGRFHFIRESQKSTWIPFQFINNVIIIPIHINESDSLHVILDTGLNTTLISELSIGDTISLNYAGRVVLRGLGVGEPLEALHSPGNNVRVAGLYGMEHTVYVLLQDIFHLSQSMGRRIHGIIGYELFKDTIIEIRYLRQNIVFHNPKHYRYNYSGLSRRNAAMFPLDISNNKAYISASVEIDDTTETAVRLLVDTGASFGLWLHPESDPSIRVPDKYIEAFLGKGLSGDIFGKISRIKRIRLGPFIFDEPIVSFPDTTSVGYVAKLESRHGSIGSEILRRFDVIIDYPNRMLTLIPNRNIDAPFRYNMSGIEINAPVPDLPIFIISHIRENSPASEAGLEVGDQIYNINGIRAVDLSLAKIVDLLLERDGRRIDLTVIRDGEPINATFHLRKVI